jgi:uncharacterized LabA/DUF88 family protein
LIESVQRKGVRVSVVSTVRTQPPMVADDLRRQADNFIDLMDITEFIARVGGTTSSNAGTTAAANTASESETAGLARTIKA